MGCSWCAAKFNDLPVGLTTNVKLFADDASLFLAVNNASVSASRLNNDLVKIWDWDFNWKMSFKPNPTEQAKEVVFSKKEILGTHLSFFFNNSLTEQDTTQKHLGLTLDHKLTFQYHVNEKIKTPRKELVFFENCSLFYLEHLCWISKNRL